MKTIDNFEKWIKTHWRTDNNFSLDKLKQQGTYEGLPFTYKEFYDLFNIKLTLNKEFKLIDFKDELDSESEEPTGVHIGAIKLEDIGKHIGNLTPAGVKTLEDNAKSKLNLFKLIDDELELENNWIENLELAKEIYIEDFLQFEDWSYIEMLNKLEKEKYITKSEYKTILSHETIAVEYLHDKLNEGSRELVEAYLEEDLMEDNSTVKSFQNIFARLWEQTNKWKPTQKKKKTIDDF